MAQKGALLCAFRSQVTHYDIDDEKTGRNKMGIQATCKEVHRLTSERLDRKLSMVERARVRMHLLVCIGCRNFDGQMRLIKGAMRRLGGIDTNRGEHESR
jgi:hypothetical protein